MLFSLKTTIKFHSKFYYIVMLLFFIITACVADTHESEYENSVFRAVLIEQRNKLVRFELVNIQTSAICSWTPELMVYDDGVHIEGGLTADYNKLIGNDIKSCSIEDIFSCDSVYSIITDSIEMTFGLESRALGQTTTPFRRLDLTINDSKLSDFSDGEYTLYSVIR